MVVNLLIRIGTYEKFNEAMIFFKERGYKWASGTELVPINEKNKGDIDYDKWTIHKSETMFIVNVKKKTISLSELTLIHKNNIEGDWVMNLNTFDKKEKQVLKNI